FADEKGRLWFAFNDGTVIRIDRGEMKRLSSPDNSPVGHVRAIGGKGDHIWIAGETVLALFDGIRFRSVLLANSEAVGGVACVLQVPRGDLWLCGDHGVLHVDGTEVKRALGDSSQPMRYELFD